MTVLRSHSELDTLPGGKYRLTQHIKPIAYDHGGGWTRITNQLGPSGDPNLTIGVDELVKFRLRDRLAGNSPVFHFGRGQSHIRFTPLDTDNVQGVPVGNNGWRYPAAWPNADLQLVIGGHILRKNIYLRSGHPASFAFRIDDHANFDPVTLSTPDFRVVNPVLENPATGESIGLAWIVSQQGGKYILTCNLPQGDYAGWVLDPTLTLQPGAADGKDTTNLSWVPNDNGGLSDVAVGNPSAVLATTLIGFNLTSIPIGATLITAIMSLYYQDSANKGVNNWVCNVFRILNSWVEGAGGSAEIGSPCWNYRVYDTSAWNTVGCRGSGTDHSATLMASAQIPDPGAGFADFSLDLSEFALMQASNNGTVVRANTEAPGQFDWFSSSDNATAANRPKLVVEYTLPAAKQARAPWWGRF